MKSIKNNSKWIVLPMMIAVAFALVPRSGLAQKCDQVFVTDIGPGLPAQGTSGTVFNSCSLPGCNDYFDLFLCSGQTVTLSLCSGGGTADFDTGLSVWNGAGFSNLISCEDDQCGLLSELVFTPVVSDTYRFRIGGFGGASGTYTLFVDVPPDCSNNIIPTMSEWGLIILALLLLNIGTVFFIRRQTLLAGVGNIRTKK